MPFFLEWCEREKKSTKDKKKKKKDEVRNDSERNKFGFFGKMTFSSGYFVNDIVEFTIGQYKQRSMFKIYVDFSKYWHIDRYPNEVINFECIDFWQWISL